MHTTLKLSIIPMYSNSHVNIHQWIKNKLQTSCLNPITDDYQLDHRVPLRITAGITRFNGLHLSI